MTPSAVARVAVALLLSLPYARALGAPADPPQDPPLRRIPETAIREGDERPLALIQDATLNDAIAVAREALDREAEWLSSHADPARSQRVETDRAMLELLGARVRGTAVAPPPARELPPIDRFLLGFAEERLRAIAVPVSLIETWSGSNRRFLESGDIRRRDEALHARDRVINALQVNAMLREVTIKITRDGPLDPVVRGRLLTSLREAFPDAPLPSPAAPTPPSGLAASLAALTPTGAAAGVPRPGGLPAGPTGPAASALPRLDGVEAPLFEIPELRAALERLRAASPPPR